MNETREGNTSIMERKWFDTGGILLLTERFGLPGNGKKLADLIEVKK